MIEVRVGNDNGISLRSPMGLLKRFFASQFWVHAAVEHKPLTRSLEVITVGADLDAPCPG